jgi:hypothetical protein
MVTVQEYLATSFRPDRDYVDGQIQERNLGEQPHSLTQTNLASFSTKGGQSGISAY